MTSPQELINTAYLTFLGIMSPDNWLNYFYNVKLKCAFSSGLQPLAALENARYWFAPAVPTQY